MAELRVRRTGDAGSFYRRLKLLVDGTVVAALRPGEEVTVNISEGRRSLQASQDWVRSPEVEVDVHPHSAVTATIAFTRDSYWKSFLKPKEALYLNVN